jgi:hypothetical protein
MKIRSNSYKETKRKEVKHEKSVAANIQQYAVHMDFERHSDKLRW